MKALEKPYTTRSSMEKGRICSKRECASRAEIWCVLKSMERTTVMCAPQIIRLNQLRFICKRCFMGQFSQLAGCVSLPLVPAVYLVSALAQAASGNGEVSWAYFLYPCTFGDHREIKLTSRYLHFAGEEGNMAIECKRAHTCAWREEEAHKANTQVSANTFLPFT